jgi:serine phosphatase RsbU (regulator of sigma subunit)
MFNKIKNYFIGHRIKATNDVFEIAKINLVFHFTFFMTLLAIPFIIQLYINQFWYHFSINLFEAVSLLLIYILFRTKTPLKNIGILFVLMDSIMSIGSLIFQNGYFEIQAGLWSMLLIIYTFFVLGKKWGFIIFSYIALLYLACMNFENGISFLNFGIPKEQILPTASFFIVFPFILNIYIISVFVNTNLNAEKLMREQKQILEFQKKEIISSINYAKRIQQANLPPKDEIYNSLPNSFILYKPKDIVSGDFYFFQKKDNSIFIAAADCTGHGVPGAFMSMLSSEKLTNAVNQSSDTSVILSLLNNGIKASLRQTDNETSTRDGLDIALCCIEMGTGRITFSGANRPIWIIRKNQTNIEEIKGAKHAIGGLTDENQNFEKNEIYLTQGDTFYICTDGYADQFGSTDCHIKGKKLMTKKFKEILLNIQDKTMKNQEIYLNDFIENWISNTEQIDDILVIGIRL